MSRSIQENQRDTLQDEGHISVNAGGPKVSWPKKDVKTLSGRHVPCQGKCWELWLDQTLQILMGVLRTSALYLKATGNPLEGFKQGKA